MTRGETWRLDNSRLPEALIGAAILAANPHNTQSRLFALGDERIDMYGDLVRHSTAMDPATREFYIGLGCALENLVLAAQAAGYSGRLTLLPEPLNQLLAGSIELGSARRSIHRSIPFQTSAVDQSNSASGSDRHAGQRHLFEFALVRWDDERARH